MNEPGQFRVLLVDDVVEIRFLLREVLLTTGRFVVVAEAGDGVEAVEEAQRHQPDLVILDLSMPRMDGLEALPLIREKSPRSKVVVLSGFEERRLGQAALSRGASSYLEKGVHPQDLVNELLRVLEAA